ncbi:hypothetical protein AB6A40_011120 [Gnathostoma spinigerum]|uniref:Uncharacterized protein n=1 Tax=Gnathostoma spinigerum TaxID=75299 RepID=A0ABD6EWY3_9BILA
MITYKVRPNKTTIGDHRWAFDEERSLLLANDSDNLLFHSRRISFRMAAKRVPLGIGNISDRQAPCAMAISSAVSTICIIVCG